MKSNRREDLHQLRKSFWIARSATFAGWIISAGQIAFAGQIVFAGFIVACVTAPPAHAQTSTTPQSKVSAPYQETTEDYNRRLTDITRSMSLPSAANSVGDYRIGADDQLDITILEAPELDRAPRVSATGEISLALVGTVRAAGLTTQELQVVIEELLRRNYINDPHVSVQVKDMQSHPVSVFGAVKKPGVFQIRGSKTVIELLSMAEGLDVDAGDMVIIEHRGQPSKAASDASEKSKSTNALAANRGALPRAGDSPARGPFVPDEEPAIESMRESTSPAATASEPSTEQVDLKRLLATGDPRLNVQVYPGDVVKVPRAELVYVVGEVGRPGGFELKGNENISILQAIALAQGLTHTSAASKARIIRTNTETGERKEIQINLNKIIAGQVADPLLEPRDIVFVPNSVGKAALYRGVDAALTIGAGVAVYRW